MKRTADRMVAIAVMTMVAGTAAAHHSFAMFARDQEMTVVGTVKEFKWVNPHSWVRVTVVDDNGIASDWSLEASAPNVLGRRGWTRSSLKPGDKVEIRIHPLKDGGPGGQLRSVTLAAGKVLED